MKRTRKLQLAIGVLGMTAAVTGFALISNPVQAQANEQALFAMETGASVRAVENEAGIRWETSVNKAWYDDVVKGKAITNYSFGTFVTSANNVSSVTDLNEYFTNEVTDLPCEVIPTFKNETTFTYYSAIVYNNMNEWEETERTAAYATELIARSYMKYSTDGGSTYTYVYADATDSARCMRAVALAAYEETDPEKVLTSTEKAVVDDYFTLSATPAVDFGGYYEKVDPETVTGGYTVAYNGAKKVGTVESGELKLDSGLTLGDKYTLTLFTADGAYVKTTEFQYVTQTLDDKAEFLSVIHPSAATTLTGYYVMTADIDVSSGTKWTATAVLNGTFDGGNHKLTGLNIDQSSGIFANVTDATITTTVKNINITDAILFRLSGVIIAETAGNVTVENVYISLAPQKFGERGDNYTNQTATGVSASNAKVNENYYEWKAGVVYNVNGNCTVTVKDSVIYMPEFVAKSSGFVLARVSNTTVKVNVDGCTFIGGNGRINGNLYNQYIGEGEDRVLYNPLSENNTTVCDAVAAHTTHKESWNEMQKKAYDTNHPYVELNSQNIVATLEKGLTNQIVALQQDIDAATGALINTNKHSISSTNVATPSTFTGVFDGQGHTIDGLTAQNWSRGMFLCAELRGSVKNVAFTNVNWKHFSDCGIIAMRVVDGYVANVYIEQTDTTSNRENCGAIAKYVEGLNMKDVVVYTKQGSATATNTMAGLYGWQTGTMSYNVLENCYYVTYDENAYHADGVVSATKNLYGNTAVTLTMTTEYVQKQETFFGIQSFKGENAKANFDKAVNNGELQMSEALKAMVLANQ